MPSSKGTLIFLSSMRQHGRWSHISIFQLTKRTLMLIASRFGSEKIKAKMYSRLRLARKYVAYYLSASNGKGHGIHSPFVFDLVTLVLNDNRDYPAYDPVEGLREKLLHDRTILEIEDLGAGSRTGQGHHASGNGRGVIRHRSVA